MHLSFFSPPRVCLLACLQPLHLPSESGSVSKRDALQDLNWISCRISGTPLKCMWASLNDALIFALQRHFVCVCVCVCVILHQLAQPGQWHTTGVFALSVQVIALS